MFNNVASAAMDSFWDSRSLRRSEMMTVDASEFPVLAMILSEGGGGAGAGNREACLDTGHGGVIF